MIPFVLQGHLYRRLRGGVGCLAGKDAGGLSASTIARLKEAWIDEDARWLDRDLSTKQYVTSGPTASKSRPGSKTTRSVCW